MGTRKDKVIALVSIVIACLFVVGGTTYCYLTWPLKMANHILKPETQDEDQAIVYRTMTLPNDKIAYTVRADTHKLAHSYNLRDPARLTFDDVENDDGYHLGFKYNFNKKQVSYFYYETNDEGFHLKTTSIAQQTYKLDDNGRRGRLIKQRVNLSQQDHADHRSKGDLLNHLQKPKKTEKYLLDHRIDFKVLKDKTTQDIEDLR